MFFKKALLALVLGVRCGGNQTAKEAPKETPPKTKVTEDNNTKPIKIDDTNATKPVKELTLREKVVGEYESKMDGDTGRLVLLENGIKELYLNGEKGLESTWSISKEGELHLIFVEGGFTGVARINKDSSITTIAEITKDGRRRDHSKEEQLTFKKIK